MKILTFAFALTLVACAADRPSTSTAPTQPATSTAATTTTTAPPACQGHVANGQCYADFAAACAALACAAPNECISLETFPPQAECRTPPAP